MALYPIQGSDHRYHFKKNIFNLPKYFTTKYFDRKINNFYRAGHFLS